MHANSKKWLFIRYLWYFGISVCAKAVQLKTVLAPHWGARSESWLFALNCRWRFFGASGIKATMTKDSIDNLARKLAESVPEGLRSMRDDLETNFRGVLQSGINKLDLVTREEFEVQEAVLARTREKLERLEVKLQELEKNL